MSSKPFIIRVRGFSAVTEREAEDVVRSIIRKHRSFKETADLEPYISVVPSCYRTRCSSFDALINFRTSLPKFLEDLDHVVRSSRQKVLDRFTFDSRFEGVMQLFSATSPRSEYILPCPFQI